MYLCVRVCLCAEILITKVQISKYHEHADCCTFSENIHLLNRCFTARFRCVLDSAAGFVVIAFFEYL